MVNSYFKGWFSTDELIAAAKKEGILVSATQIARWHRRGLLPTPKRDYTTGRRGSVTKYPPGAKQTLLAICKVQTGRTPMDEVSWSLWWGGNDRDLADIRRYMGKVAGELDDLIVKVRNAIQKGEASKGIPVSVRGTLLGAPALRGPLGWIRRPLSHGDGNDWPVMVDLLLGVMNGEVLKITSHHKKAITGALHQGEAYEVTMEDRLNWMPAQNGEAFVWFAGFMQRPLVDRLAELGDEELLLARDEARQLFEFGLTFGEIMAWLFGPDGLGYGFMKKVLEAVFGKPERQVFLVLMIHAFLSDVEYGDNFDALHQIYEQWDGVSEGHRCLMTLVDEVPGLNAVVTPAAMSAAVKSSIRREHLVQRLREFRQQHASEIDAVKERHPELNWGVTFEIEAGSEGLT